MRNIRHRERDTWETKKRGETRDYNNYKDKSYPWLTFLQSFLGFSLAQFNVDSLFRFDVFLIR